MLGRLDAATEVTVEQYLAASADRERVRAGFARLFFRVRRPLHSRQCRLTAADRGGDGGAQGAELTFRDLIMGYTTPQDLVGLPACAVRAGFDALGIPVGLQFTGPQWSEARVLRAAQGLFDATPEVQARRPAL